MASDKLDFSLFAFIGPVKRRRITAAWKRSSRVVAAVAARIIVSLGMAALVLFMLWKFPQWLAMARSVPDVKERLLMEEELFKILIQMLGGAFLLAGLYFTWRNTYLSKEGQITDRFNKAIDHLGNDKAEVRLGGVYALARIAKDSPKDHWTIMQVLCTFLRTRSRESVSDPESVGTEVQTVLDVLGDRSAEYESVDQCLDLRGLNLKRANLRGALLDRAQLDESNLQHADLMRASLARADCRGANFNSAHLREARLDGANLMAADLRGASLRAARLRGANILGAQMDKATLIGADLTGVQFATKDQISSAICDESTRLPEFLEASGVSAKQA